GTRAKPAARPRLRTTASQETLERGPKQAHGAPARPRRSAPTVNAANRNISAAAAYAAVSEPSATATARPSSIAISPAQPIGRSLPSSKPKLASEAMLARGEASFASAAPASTIPSATRKKVSTVPPFATYHQAGAATVSSGRCGSARPGLLLASPPLLLAVD